MHFTAFEIRLLQLLTLIVLLGVGGCASTSPNAGGIARPSQDSVDPSTKRDADESLPFALTSHHSHYEQYDVKNPAKSDAAESLAEAMMPKTV